MPISSEPKQLSVEEVIAEQLGVDVSQVTPDANLVRDLHASPEDMLALNYELTRAGFGSTLELLTFAMLDGAPKSWWKYAHDQGFIGGRNLPKGFDTMADDAIIGRVPGGAAPGTVARIRELFQK